jgi:hypothetical protein
MEYNSMFNRKPSPHLTQLCDELMHAALLRAGELGKPLDCREKLRKRIQNGIQAFVVNREITPARKKAAKTNVLLFIDYLWVTAERNDRGTLDSDVFRIAEDMSGDTWPLTSKYAWSGQILNRKTI